MIINPKYTSNYIYNISSGSKTRDSEDTLSHSKIKTQSYSNIYYLPFKGITNDNKMTEDEYIKFLKKNNQYLEIFSSKHYLNSFALMNILNGKYSKYWKENPDIFFQTYKRLYNCGLMLSEISNGASEAIMASALSNPTKDITQIIESYKSNSTPYNNLLTNDFCFETISGDDKETKRLEIEKLTQFINKFANKTALTVYRGSSYDIFKNVILSSGKNLKRDMNDLKRTKDKTKIKELEEEILNRDITVHNKRFTSTFLTENTYENSAFSQEDAKWEILIPKSTNGLFLELLCRQTIYSDECEYLLQRGVDLKINEINFDFDEDKWNIKAEVKDINYNDDLEENNDDN